MQRRPLRLETRVAHAGFEEHRFAGHGLFADLAGSADFWTVVSLGIGGPRLSPEDGLILSDCATCGTVADPRIWPLKLTRLVASYGGATEAYSAGTLFLAGAQLGASAVRRAAELLEELSARQRAPVGTPERMQQLRRWAHLQTAGRRRIPGFGVPFRPRDERVEPLRRCAQQRGRQAGPSWRLAERVAQAVAEAGGPAENVTLLMAALCLDLGFTPAQAEQLAVVFQLPSLLANAHEGAQQAPAVLRCLPSDAIEYIGPPPRISPRASGDDTA